MYTVYIVGIMILMPSICVISEYFLTIHKKHVKLSMIYLICKWFIFWALGIRSFSAGIMQSINPSFTAKMLQTGTSNYVMIRELGFANISMGILAICSLFQSKWRSAASLCIGAFFAMCTFLHISRYGIQLSFDEVIATISDAWAIIISITCLANSNKCNKVN